MRPEEADAARRGLAHLQTAMVPGGGLQAIVWLEEWCEDCKHSGLVESPIWRRFTQDFNIAHPTSGRPREQHDQERADAYEKAWWEQVGFALDDLPPEEVPCARCEGHGRKVTRDGLALYAFVARWWSP